MPGFFSSAVDQLPQPPPNVDGGGNDAPAAVLEIAADSTPLLPGEPLQPRTFSFFIHHSHSSSTSFTLFCLPHVSLLPAATEWGYVTYLELIATLTIMRYIERYPDAQYGVRL